MGPMCSPGRWFVHSARHLLSVLLRSSDVAHVATILPVGLAAEFAD